MPTIDLILPRPHEAQRRIISEAKRFNPIACGRRFGKTTLGIDRTATPETLNHPVGWFNPTYKMMLEVWREVTRIFKPITLRKNTQERRIEFVTGGLLEFWSLDNPDAARGRKYRRAIIDEAAMVANLMDAWQYVIRPTLVDLEGDAYFLSTPKGMNGFWQMYQWGLDPHMSDWACWQMPTSANPFIVDSEIEEMRRTMPERIFRQEILAEFIEDAGGVFRGVREAATAERQTEPIEGHDYVFGVDWGQQNDFTVITVIDITLKSLVYLDRFNQIDYTIQSQRLMALAEKFRPVQIIAEVNAMGQPIVEQLWRQNLPVEPFTTTNASKTAAVDGLALAFERNDITILDDPVLIAELQAYEMKRLESGLRKFSAPEGLHDDCVMSLVIGWQGVGAGSLLMW